MSRKQINKMASSKVNLQRIPYFLFDDFNIGLLLKLYWTVIFIIEIHRTMFTIENALTYNFYYRIT